MNYNDRKSYEKAREHNQNVTQRQIIEKRKIRAVYKNQLSLNEICDRKKDQLILKQEAILESRFSYLYNFISRPAHGKTIFTLNNNFSFYISQYDGGRYSSRCKYRIIYTDRTIGIPAGSKKPEIESFDGIPNLAIKELNHKVNGITIYKAIWLKHGKGYNQEVVYGFIASKDGYNYHAKTIKESVSGIMKKINRFSTPEKITLETKITRRLYHIITGACYEGIDDFLEKANILVKSMTVENLLPILEKHNAYGLNVLKKIILK